MKGLDGMIRLSRWTLDAARKELAAAESELAAIDARLAELDAAMTAEAGSELSPELAMGQGAWVQATLTRRRSIEAERAAAESVRAAHHEVVRDAYRELKKYEVMADRRAARARADAARREQAGLDEIGLQVHRRATEEDGA